MEPDALYLLRRFRAGESVGRLVSTEGIARERILVRLRVARRYERAHRHALQTDNQELPRMAAA
jgi:hypothetical protein